MSAGAYTRTPGSAKEPAHPAEQPPPARLDGTPAAAERTAQPVAHGGPRPPMTIAQALWLGAGEERLAPRLRAAGRRQQSGRRVDVPPHDVVGDGERPRRAGAGGGTHEVDPDGKRPLRTGETRRRTVVEADPHARDDLGREADEPGVARVVRRSRLAGRGAVDAGATGAPGRSGVDHALEEVRHEIRDARVEHVRLLAGR